MYVNDPRLGKLFQLLHTLRSKRCTANELAKKIQVSDSTLDQYLDQLNDVGFNVERDVNQCYFISATEDSRQLVNEEFAIMSLLVQPNPTIPLDMFVHRKVKLHFDRLVDQLTEAMRTKHQVILHEYMVDSDLCKHVVEPLHFGKNHSTIVALDTNDLKCKPFSLYRICDLVKTQTLFFHQVMHRCNPTDVFGMEGEPVIWVKVKLQKEAYLQLRLEYPRSIAHITRKNNEYTFHGPVASFAGIARFVLTVLNLVDIEEPEEFTHYLWRKIASNR